jgi:hypothetical protein
MALLDRADLGPAPKRRAQRRELFVAIEGYLSVHLDER